MAAHFDLACSQRDGARELLAAIAAEPAWNEYDQGVPSRCRRGAGVRRLGVVAAVAYVGTILAANWAVDRFGIVPVGFGYKGPAAVYIVGLAFTLQDVVHELLGAAAVFVAILAGAVLSLLVSPAFAVASAAAFLVSELTDLAVYSPLRERRPLLALGLSNTVGLVLDSLIFLWLAFGSLEFLPGQIIGKAWMTALALLLRVAWLRRRQAAAS